MPATTPAADVAKNIRRVPRGAENGDEA